MSYKGFHVNLTLTVLMLFIYSYYSRLKFILNCTFKIKSVQNFYTISFIELNFAWINNNSNIQHISNILLILKFHIFFIRNRSIFYNIKLNLTLHYFEYEFQ